MPAKGAVQIAPTQLRRPRVGGSIGRRSGGSACPRQLTHIPKGADFIPISARNATYQIFVAAENPHEANLERDRLTVGGGRIEYKGDFSAKYVDIATDNGRFMAVDIKDFYLNTPMDTYEYMRVRVKDIPDTIMTPYQPAPLSRINYADGEA
jgi:hypothetical protein